MMYCLPSVFGSVFLSSFDTQSDYPHPNILASHYESIVALRILFPKSTDSIQLAPILSSKKGLHMGFGSLLP